MLNPHTLQNKQVTIYGLVDPRGPELFYVGATKCKPSERLSGHIAGAKRTDTALNGRVVKARIRAILAAGVRPKYVVLELNASPASEHAWIEYFVMLGLANIVRPNRNEIGQHYGQWTVIGHASTRRKPNGGRVRMWRCQCTCGRIRNVQEHNLHTGGSTRCDVCRIQAVRQRWHIQKRTR